MAKKSKLLAALDAHKGRDYQVEKQKELQKKAKRKKKEQETPFISEDPCQPANQLQNNSKLDNGIDGWESDGSEDESVAVSDLSIVQSFPFSSALMVHSNAFVLERHE